MALKENYKDDILDTSQNVKRKYQMENNGDGTVSFTDVTEYTQQGDSFGASDMNATNTQVNANTGAIQDLNDNLSGFKFYPTGTAIVGLVADDSPYTDSDGNYIIASSTTGQSMIDNVTYKSINSTEDCRGEVGADTATPFKSERPSTQGKISVNPLTTNTFTPTVKLSGHYYLRIILFMNTSAYNIDTYISGATFNNSATVLSSTRTPSGQGSYRIYEYDLDITDKNNFRVDIYSGFGAFYGTAWICLIAN